MLISIHRLAAIVLWPVFKVVGLLAYLLIRTLEPWRRIRVGFLENDRIGHQTINTEMFLRARFLDGEEKTCLDIFVSAPPANQQLDRMIRRRLNVFRLPLLGLLYREGLKPWIAGSRFEADVTLHYDDYQRRCAAPPQLSFTPEEEQRGRELLESMGVPAGAPFVCFHSRSAAFLNARHPRAGAEGWSYHDYRDCRIENFIAAAEFLAERGIYALRMGAVVDEPFQPSHPKIIDYAAKHRCDFGDIYLTGRCKFFIGNTAGIVCAPWTFGVPVLMTNVIPLFIPRAFHPSDIVLPKQLWDKRRERHLTFQEMRDSATWDDTRLFAKAGIEFRENTSEDILEAATELNARIDNAWTPHPDDAELEGRFQALVPVEPIARGCEYRMGAGFLRRNRALLDLVAAR